MRAPSRTLLVRTERKANHESVKPERIVATNLNRIHVSLNLLTGCTKKSAGCVNCYAERHARRLSEDADPKVAWKYRNGFTLTEHTGLLSKSIGGSPKLIFLNSMSDTFRASCKTLYEPAANTDCTSPVTSI
jgi:protein gp37